MNKAEFLTLLSNRLSQLPPQEAEKSISYFSEIIDDRVEDGMTEEEAVESLEEIDKIVEQIMYDTPLPMLMKSKMKRDKKLATWQLVLIIAGFPIWFPLLMTACALVFTIYLVIWILIICLFAVVFTLGLSGLAALVTSPVTLLTNTPAFLAQSGIGLFAMGACLLLFYPTVLLSKKLVRLTVWVSKKIKSIFIAKEGAVS